MKAIPFCCLAFPSLQFVGSDTLQPFEEKSGRAEGAVGHRLPETLVLLLVMVCPRCIADDAETDERYMGQEARLCDGCRFHIHSQGLWEMRLDAVQFVKTCDEAVSRADESCVYAVFHIVFFVQCQGLFHP